MNITRPHPNVVVRTTAHINLSADQWGLRTSDHSRCIIDKVADSFNKRLTSDFNQGATLTELTAAFQGLGNYFLVYCTGDTIKVFEKLCGMLYRTEQ